jgi:hypothetical protein
MNINRQQFGGLVSFLAFLAAAVFFGLEVFNFSLGSVPLTAAGLFSLALAFVLSRLQL